MSRQIASVFSKGGRRLKFQPFIGIGPPKRQSLGVQAQSRGRGLRTIERIAQDGRTQATLGRGGSEVHPNLMGAAGLGSKFQTHRLPLLVERRFDGSVMDPPKCARRPPRIVADFLARPAGGFRVLDQWGFNRP